MLSVPGFLSLAALFSTTLAAPTATITNGTIIGSNDASTGVDKFLGVPYAEPPVDNLRLRHSEPLRHTLGDFNATAFGPACYGRSDDGPAGEDCLTLNIWRPAGVTGEDSVPVFVWLYGGGLTAGSAVGPYTNLGNIYPPRSNKDSYADRRTRGPTGRSWPASRRSLTYRSS